MVRWKTCKTHKPSLVEIGHLFQKDIKFSFFTKLSAGKFRSSTSDYSQPFLSAFRSFTGDAKSMIQAYNVRSYWHPQLSLTACAGTTLSPVELYIEY